MRVAVARAVSIAGHPVVLLLVAALITASRRGASLRQLWLISGALVTLGVVVLGFSWLQVRAGRWSHIDASVRNERNSLNVFLGVSVFSARCCYGFWRGDHTCRSGWHCRERLLS